MCSNTIRFPCLPTPPLSHAWPIGHLRWAFPRFPSISLRRGIMRSSSWSSPWTSSKSSDGSESSWRVRAATGASRDSLGVWEARKGSLGLGDAYAWWCSDRKFGASEKTSLLPPACSQSRTPAVRTAAICLGQNLGQRWLTESGDLVPYIKALCFSSNNSMGWVSLNPVSATSRSISSCVYLRISSPEETESTTCASSLSQ